MPLNVILGYYGLEGGKSSSVMGIRTENQFVLSVLVKNWVPEWEVMQNLFEMKIENPGPENTISFCSLNYSTSKLTKFGTFQPNIFLFWLGVIHKLYLTQCSLHNVYRIYTQQNIIQSFLILILRYTIPVLRYVWPFNCTF